MIGKFALALGATLPFPTHALLAADVPASYIAGGKACVREGEYNFKISGARKFWRMQGMDNPCEPPNVDYVDVRFDQ